MKFLQWPIQYDLAVVILSYLAYGFVSYKIYWLLYSLGWEKFGGTVAGWRYRQKTRALYAAHMDERNWPKNLLAWEKYLFCLAISSLLFMIAHFFVVLLSVMLES